MGPGAREQLARVARMRPLLTYGLSFFAVQTRLELGRAYLWLKDKYDPAVILDFRTTRLLRPRPCARR